MKVFKDKVCKRIKAFNTLQLVDLYLTVQTRYYQEKLLEIAAGKQKSLYSNIPLQDVTNVGNGIYTVNSQSKRGYQYIVETAGTCNCPVGVSGAVCKHQVAVAFHCREPLPNCLPATQAQRELLYKIATGKDANTALPVGFFKSIHEKKKQSAEESVQKCGFSEG